MMFKPDLGRDFREVAVMAIGRATGGCEAALTALARQWVALDLHLSARQMGSFSVAFRNGMIAAFTATGRTRTVLEQVAAERRRQLAKGWDEGHDDGQSVDTLARNAALIINGSIGGWVDASRHDRREQLVIGAALAIAAIERLDREEARAA